ncbi:phage tail protein [Streptomyces sp. NPDC058603]|uniref:phage tail protein n=1 Tax=Streptomyces sp. NPDC058603 TaxID=3346551 RepID=UPI0036516278
MRAAVEGLGSPYSLAELLPTVFREDPFTVRFTAGWDEVVAPVATTLDCLDAYLDPWLAPEDFLVWLADRLGTGLDENWPLARKRAVTAHALRGHRTRGTGEGLRARLALATGGEVELHDSGGVHTSVRPETPFPDRTASGVVVRVTVEHEQDADPVELQALVRECLPAHVPCHLEVVRR